MLRHLIIGFLGFALIYVSTEIPHEPNLLTAIGFIIGLCMVIGAAGGIIAEKTKSYSKMLRDKNRQMEAGIDERTSTHNK